MLRSVRSVLSVRIDRSARSSRFAWFALSAFSVLFILAACSREPMEQFAEDESAAGEVSHEMMVLGRKLKDPYAVKNMSRALDKVCPTRASRQDLAPTDLYLRFLPENEEEYQRLLAAGVQLMDHPLDYQILRDGDYYHDPSLPEDRITWQYAVWKKDRPLPPSIRYEELEECFIPEHDISTRNDGLDWAAVEREAYRLTGNGALIAPATRAEEVRPKGRITIEDAEFSGGKPFGVAGVKVVCNSFVKFSSAYTDRDGYYEMPRSYASKVRYRLFFSNKLKFNIGLNLILVPASSSALGKGEAEGIDVHISEASDRRLFCRSVVNNAVYDYICRCGAEDLDISRPPEGFRIWLLQKTAGSAALMIHHGAVADLPLVSEFLGDYAGLVKTFLPDALLGCKGRASYADLWSMATHECAHASHFRQAGSRYWNRYVLHILKSVLETGSPYGSGTEENAGYCEVGEMWAFFLESRLFNDRYGGELPDREETDWFHPQIFRYIHDRGFSVADLFSVLDEGTVSREKLKERLIRRFPTKEELIRQVFDSYEEPDWD